MTNLNLKHETLHTLGGDGEQFATEIITYTNRDGDTIAAFNQQTGDDRFSVCYRWNVTERYISEFEEPLKLDPEYIERCWNGDAYHDAPTGRYYGSVIKKYRKNM
jgi:hypothetical protein|tara:strand:- start:36 stop:350 length:315 start_codon:yes stop_codon:yes gene_type:complete